MKSYLTLNNKKLHYSDQGKGNCLVFLHGYLESLDIWGDFAAGLSANYRVICLDLPGHGKSQELSETHSMEQLAGVIFLTLKKLKVKKSFMIGHSMGGYVTLMFHFLYPELLFGFSLFHSHPFADNEQIINKRLREIDFVREGKKDLIASVNIPNAFASDNLNIFTTEIEKAKTIALQTSEEGIIANLQAMISRPDMLESLKNSNIPFFYVIGKKDSYIDYNLLITNVQLPKNAKLLLLEKSGHMGFIEEMEELNKNLRIFIKKYLKS